MVNPDFFVIDPRDKLQRVSRTALAYGINLDDQVHRVSVSRNPVRGSRAFVHQGTMVTGTKVAIKTLRFRPPSDDMSIKVSVRSSYYGLTTTLFSVFFLKSPPGLGCAIGMSLGCLVLQPNSITPFPW